MYKTVYFVKDTERDEIHLMCKTCFNKAKKENKNLENIDKAGDFDECGDCGAQNVPSWYRHNPHFIAGTMN